MKLINSLFFDPIKQKSIDWNKTNDKYLNSLILNSKTIESNQLDNIKVIHLGFKE